MTETLHIDDSSKAAHYSSLLPQIKALCDGESSSIANQANIVAALHHTFGFFWTGFYWAADENNLVLGPFQGPIACTRIEKGKGVCGTAWHDKKTLVVPNVEDFPGHIACSADSKSEIVVPLFKNKDVVGVLDIDSDTIGTFDEIDKKHLNTLCQWIGEHIV